jgi:signal transduction histidine kinase
MHDHNMGLPGTGFLRGIWERYLAANDWDRIVLLCQPGGLLILFASIIAIQFTLCVYGAKGYANYSDAVLPTACVTLAVICDLIVWWLAKLGRTRLVPVLVLLDGAGYSTCVVATALCVTSHYAFGFWAIYFAVLLYWGYFSEFSGLHVISISVGPLTLLAIHGADPVLFALVGFSLVAHVFAATGTARRNELERIEKRARESVSLMDLMLNSYHEKLMLSQSAFVLRLNNMLSALNMGMQLLTIKLEDEGSRHADMAVSLLDASSNAVWSLNKYFDWGKGDGHFPAPEIASNVSVLGCEVGEIPPVEILGDPDQVMLALENLIGNSTNAPATNIRVTFRVEKKLLMVDVTDDGHGLSGITRRDLFRPSISAENAGYGMRLYLARHLFRLMHGDLELVETNSGGTTFRATLRITGVVIGCQSLY